MSSPAQSSHASDKDDFAQNLRKLYDRDLDNRRLGVTWTDLTVRGVSQDASIHDNVISQFDIVGKIRSSSRQQPVQVILDNSQGNVKPGEMLLVLGRPGSGCTTLLNVLSNRRNGYKDIDGNVWYGSMGSDEAKKFRGQIAMNSEEELFYPTLTVQQTIDFATRLKRPRQLPSSIQSRDDYLDEMREFLLSSMNISHTRSTKVGNEYVRGVSGGERKRVSILETLATRASIFCWDNSTRGLDASTALEYTRAIRTMTDALGLTSIVTLYQAGNGIYELFDKALVLDRGKQIYYGRRDQARQFMESLGFLCPDGANVADYLTSVTVPTERQILPGFEDRFPRNADEIRQRYQSSSLYRETLDEQSFPTLEKTKADTKAFQEAVARDKDRQLSRSSPLTTNLFDQTVACVRRQYQILWGDKTIFFITQFLTIVQALIAGSLFYNAPDNSAGLFIKGGALFLSLLYNCLLAMSEVIESFIGRPVLAKHKAFALYHPAAFCIAQIAADIPKLLFQISCFSLILYWMVGLGASASQFFTFWVMVFSTTMSMTALFRSIGAAFSTFDGASKVSGFVVMVTIMYIGYMIPQPEMHPWFAWLHWINPMAYGFEAILANEFAGLTIPCVNTNLAPNGPGYTDNAFQSCTGVRGAQQGETSVTGDAYLAALAYSRTHIWRNFGIVWAFWALFAAITVVFTMRWKASSDGGSGLLIPSENMVARVIKSDLESQSSQPGEKITSSDSSSKSEKPSNSAANLVRNTSVFTWKNLSYTVKTPDGNRKLLDDIQGWVKPGQLGALMGSSGAGKTTLLDVLAQRKTEGSISGSILVDGRPLPISFQRSAGYCEQLDVHEPLSTVREALEFSALLRQSRDTPRDEKLRYVSTIIDLLELHDIERSLIGTIGAGLSVEQRKRVTIGLELVAKPSVLLFLDEPTSGLDGQSAYNTVRFLRKLADVGQAILVTIHQPSAQLFAQFDRLLLLAKGGQTVYFGDIGENGQTVKKYFAREGVDCPAGANPAEFMIDVVSGPLSRGRNWADVWLQSPEHEQVSRELDEIISTAAAAPSGTQDDGHEFATSLWDQIKIVTQRANISLYRNTEYINNKLMLHISNALFNGFSFWMIGNGVSDLQLKLFTIFNAIFVAPGVINQLQPLFLQRRDIFEAREKKAKIYGWTAFVTALILSEVPYLCACAIIYFLCWYYETGLPRDSNRAGGIFFTFFMYEFVYTGIGQFVAAYAPSAVFAALVNPLLIGTLVSFCGTLVPYSQLQVFWRYWMYYLNPFTYLMGSMLVFSVWDADVQCGEQEYAVFDTPGNMTCGDYLQEYQQSALGSLSNLINPDATSGCKVCQYGSGSDYLSTLNLNDYYYGWRDAAIVALFAISSYALVFGLMKLRTKQSKKAE